MVENEVISIMDEGLGDEIDILVSELEYPGLLDSLSGAGASYQVQVTHATGLLFIDILIIKYSCCWKPKRDFLKKTK